jgi:Rrf2 family protein
VLYFKSVRVSQKLEYACRAMACLGKHYDGISVIKVEEIAEQEAIPASFLVQILNELKRSDLVASKRGKAGGYALTRLPSSITLADVVKAIEPNLLETPNPGKGRCGPSVHHVWSGLSEEFGVALSKISLDSIASTSDTPMYFI